jgi:membrane glycosyltransferase
LGATLALVNKDLRRGHGGAFKLIASVLVEQVFSTLLAPAMMIFHTTFVISTLAGSPVTWNAQDRGDRGVTFLVALDRHKWQIVLGLVWGAAILAMAPRYIWWMTPILSGLVLSVPLTMLTSRSSVGRWMRRRGLLLTPEETNTPAELVGLEQRLAAGPGVREAAIQSLDLSLPPPKMMAPTPAATFAPVTVAPGGATLVTSALPPLAANDESIGAAHEDDIVGIHAITNLPARKPLQMEAAVPVYLSPRDALTGLHRLISAAWTA